MLISTICAMAVGAAACVTDLQSRKIPNWLTFGAAGAALVFHTMAPTGGGFMVATAGWFCGVLIMFVPFALRGLGAGDVKLVAALGAWLGPMNAIWLGLYAGVAGFVMSVVVAAYHGYLRTAFRNIWFLLQHWTVNGIRPLEEVSLEGSSGPRLAYALPIFAGLVMATWWR
jgi:prepilin peptidase CpaA